MKFNEMTYTRPDIDALLARCRELAAKAAAAELAAENAANASGAAAATAVSVAETASAPEKD